MGCGATKRFPDKQYQTAQIMHRGIAGKPPDFLFPINADISQQCDDQSGRDDAPCADSEKLMEVLDQLNAKDGKGKAVLRRAGYPATVGNEEGEAITRYTTRYEDLLQVKCQVQLNLHPDFSHFRQYRVPQPRCMQEHALVGCLLFISGLTVTLFIGL
ncbi:Error-prone repair protein UmuC [Salmonella enterica subsp. arizonae]|uniref:Error-prone repair protein UmuC n=2 Tax=Salmonella enterica subsp. arizonae TaxID=59203 RepID=A0A379T842_SALER|nr:Error-prone repair protein UmuC [Salmonella enterica subsp. arizonae]